MKVVKKDDNKIVMEDMERKKCKHCGRYNTYTSTTVNFDLGDKEHLNALIEPLIGYLEDTTRFLKQFVTGS